MQFDEMPDDREAETEAAVRPSRRTVSLLEPIEDPRQKTRSYSDAGIANHDL